MSEPTVPPEIERFMRSVYGDEYYQLALASFNEKRALDKASDKIQILERELAEARAALRDWYNYLHDDDDWDDMVSPASHQWRVRHAAALKAAQEDKP